MKTKVKIHAQMTAFKRSKERTPTGARRDRWVITTAGPEGGEMVRYVLAQDLPDAIRKLWSAYPDDGYIRGRRCAEVSSPVSAEATKTPVSAEATKSPAEPQCAKPKPTPTAKPQTLPRRTAAVMGPVRPRPKKQIDLPPLNVAWSPDAQGG